MGVYDNINGTMVRIAPNIRVQNSPVEQYVTEAELVEGLSTKLDRYDIVTPQMYGAVGDGVTDDSDAMAAFFNSGEKILYIPEGTYLTDFHKMRVPSFGGAVIFGDGSTKSIIKLKNTHNDGQFGNGITLMANNSKPSLEMRDLAIIYDNDDNNVTYPNTSMTYLHGVGDFDQIILDNCYFHLGGTATTLPIDNLVWFKCGANNIRVSNCLFENFSNRDVGGCLWFNAENDSTSPATDYTIKQISIIDNEFRNTNKDEAVAIWKLTNTTPFHIDNIDIFNNVFTHKDWNGTCYYTDGVLTLFGNENDPPTYNGNANISGNDFFIDECKEDAVRFKRLSGVLFTNNKMIINSIYDDSCKFVNVSEISPNFITVVKDNYFKLTQASKQIAVGAERSNVQFVNNVYESASDLYINNITSNTQDNFTFDFINNVFNLSNNKFVVRKAYANCKNSFISNQIHGQLFFGNLIGEGITFKKNDFYTTQTSSIAFSGTDMVWEDNNGVKLGISSAYIQTPMNSFRYRGEKNSLRFTINGQSVSDTPSVRSQFFTNCDIVYIDDTIQVQTLPTASIAHLGEVVQYIGTTNANYTHGYFYECVSDGQSTPTYSWVNVKVEDSVYVTPEMFGAKGDGVTDDTQAFTSAINAARLNGKKIFLSKRYYLASKVTTNTWTTNLVIEGIQTDNSEGSDIAKSSSIIAPNGFEVISFVTLKNIMFDGYGIQVIGNKNHINNCMFKTCDKGIEMVGGYGTHSASWYGETIIDSCYFYECPMGIDFILDSVSNRTYHDCIVRDNIFARNNIGINGYVSGTLIQNNHIYSTLCINLNGANNVVSENYLDGSGTLITMISSDGNIIVHNNMFYKASIGVDANDKAYPVCTFSGSANAILTFNDNSINQLPDASHPELVFVKITGSGNLGVQYADNVCRFDFIDLGNGVPIVSEDSSITISLNDLQSVVAASSDFADFQTRIAAL